MIFAFLAILCSASINVLFKVGTDRWTDRYVVSLTSFFTASLISLIRLSVGGSLFLFDPTLQSIVYLAIISTINGSFILGALYFLQLSTSNNGTSLTSTFNKMGVLIPTLLSILIFQESPTPFGIIGILLVVIAVILVYFDRNKITAMAMPLALFATFFFGGMQDFIAKIYESTGAADLQNHFIFLSFAIATLIALIIVIYRGSKIRRTDMLLGVLTGIPNQLNSLFILRALYYVPGYIMFPLYSGGVIVLIQVLNLLFFREKLALRQQLAIAIIVLAIALMNVGGPSV